MVETDGESTIPSGEPEVNCLQPDKGAREAGVSKTADLEQDELFWQQFRADFAIDWVEFHATIQALVSSADLVVVGRFQDVRQGAGQQTDSEKYRAEALLHILPEEILKQSDIDEDIWLSLSLLKVSSKAMVPPTICTLRRTVPQSPAVFILRKRTSGTYRLVNGFGLWTDTARRPLDAPIETHPPGDGIYAQELQQFTGFDDFLAFVRSVATGR